VSTAHLATTGMLAVDGRTTSVHCTASDGEEGTQYSSCDQQSWKQTDCEIDKVGLARTIPIVQPMQIAVKIQTLKNARHQKSNMRPWMLASHLIASMPTVLLIWWGINSSRQFVVCRWMSCGTDNLLLTLSQRQCRRPNKNRVKITAVKAIHNFTSLNNVVNRGNNQE